MRGKAMVVLISIFSRLGVNEYGIFWRRENLEALQKLRCVKKESFRNFDFSQAAGLSWRRNFHSFLPPFPIKSETAKGKEERKEIEYFTPDFVYGKRGKKSNSPVFDRKVKAS